MFSHFSCIFRLCQKYVYALFFHYVFSSVSSKIKYITYLPLLRFYKIQLTLKWISLEDFMLWTLEKIWGPHYIFLYIFSNLFFIVYSIIVVPIVSLFSPPPSPPLLPTVNPLFTVCVHESLIYVLGLIPPASFHPPPLPLPLLQPLSVCSMFPCLPFYFPS